MDTSKALKNIEKDLSPLVSQSYDVEITSKETAEQASLLLRNIKLQIKSAEDIRTSFTKPINESLRAINAKFKEATKPLKASEAVIKVKILKWQRSENERIAKDEAKRQKLQESHFEKGHNVNPLIQLDRVESVGTTSTRKVKKWKMIDFKKLPDEYKIADEVLLNKLVRGGKTDIPGIEIYEDEVLAVR